MIEAMSFVRSRYLAFNKGSVTEIVEPGITGFLSIRVKKLTASWTIYCHLTVDW